MKKIFLLLFLSLSMSASQMPHIQLSASGSEQQAPIVYSASTSSASASSASTSPLKRANAGAAVLDGVPSPTKKSKQERSASPGASSASDVTSINSTLSKESYEYHKELSEAHHKYAATVKALLQKQERELMECLCSQPIDPYSVLLCSLLKKLVTTKRLNPNATISQTDGGNHSSNQPLLYSAALTQDYEYAKLLLEAGADPNTCDNHGCLFVTYVMGFPSQFNPDEKLFKLFTTHKDFKANAQYYDYKSELKHPLLHRAIDCKNHKQIAMLLEAGADPNANCGDGRPLAKIALENEDLETIALLLKHGLKKDILKKDRT